MASYSTRHAVGDRDDVRPGLCSRTRSASYVFGGAGAAKMGGTTNFSMCNLIGETRTCGQCRVRPHSCSSPVSTSGNGFGVVTSTDGFVDCDGAGTCANGAVASVSYSSGTRVYLHEARSPRRQSTSSPVGAAPGCSGTGVCTATMTASRVVVASFTSVGPFVLAVSTR